MAVLVVGVLVVGVEVEVVGGGVLLVGGVVVVGVHVMLALMTPAGSEIEDSGVPGGRSRLSVVWMLPRSVRLITHGSAEAVGSAAIPITANAVIAATTKFRLRGTVVNLLPRICSSKPVGAATTGGVAGTLLRDTVVCNGEPSRTISTPRGRTVPIVEAITGPQARLQRYGSERPAQPAALGGSRWHDTVAASTPKGGLQKR